MNAGPKTDEPLVTFALFAFNQERFIRDAVQGAFSQTYHPLEIIFSDDCSTDRTFQLMQEAAEKYAGPHSIRLNRNPQNLGLIGHVNKLFELAKGDIIIAAAGDDISYPFRTERLVREFAHSNPLLVHSQADEIDIDGCLTGNLQPSDRLFQSPTIEQATVSLSLYLGASAAWSKELYVAYGALKYGNTYEDLALGFRAIVENRFASIREPLLQYRVGGGLSTSSPKYETLSALWQHRRKSMNHMLEVMRQRQDDYGYASRREATIEKKLAAKVEDLRIRASFYERPKSFLKVIIKEHYLPVKILLHEIAYLAKSILLRKAERLEQVIRRDRD